MKKSSLFSICLFFFFAFVYSQENTKDANYRWISITQTKENSAFYPDSEEDMTSIFNVLKNAWNKDLVSFYKEYGGQYGRSGFHRISKEEYDFHPFYYFGEFPMSAFIDSYGYDSINSNGELVFPTPEVISFYSNEAYYRIKEEGIYNKKTKSFEYKPISIGISFLRENWSVDGYGFSEIELLPEYFFVEHDEYWDQLNYVWVNVKDLIKIQPELEQTAWYKSLTNGDYMGVQYMQLPPAEIKNDLQGYKERYISVFPNKKNKALFETPKKQENLSLLNTIQSLKGKDLENPMYYTLPIEPFFTLFPQENNEFYQDYTLNISLGDLRKWGYKESDSIVFGTDNYPYYNIYGEDSINTAGEYVYPVYYALIPKKRPDEIRIKEEWINGQFHPVALGFYYESTNHYNDFEAFWIYLDDFFANLENPEQYPWYKMIKNQSYKGLTYYQLPSYTTYKDMFAEKDGNRLYLAITETGTGVVLSDYFEVIPPIYDDVVYNDEEDVFKVLLNEKWETIKLDIILDGIEIKTIHNIEDYQDSVEGVIEEYFIDYENIFDVEEDLLLETNGNKKQWITWREDGVTLKGYDEFHIQENGYIWMGLGNKQGLIDGKGNVIIPAEYDELFWVGGDYYQAKKDDLSGYFVIDRTTNNIATFQEVKTTENFDNLVVVGTKSSLFILEIKDEKINFIDKNGSVLYSLPTEPDDYLGLELLSDNLFRIKINGKFGAINQKGNVVIPVKYDKIGKFNEGLAYVKKNEKYGYINETDQLICPFVFNHATDFSLGVASIKLGEKEGWVTKDGVVLFEVRN